MGLQVHTPPLVNFDLECPDKGLNTIYFEQPATTTNSYRGLQMYTLAVPVFFKMNTKILKSLTTTLGLL